jgi:hypothetical protein
MIRFRRFQLRNTAVFVIETSRSWWFWLINLVLIQFWPSKGTLGVLLIWIVRVLGTDVLPMDDSLQPPRHGLHQVLWVPYCMLSILRTQSSVIFFCISCRLSDKSASFFLLRRNANLGLQKRNCALCTLNFGCKFYDWICILKSICNSTYSVVVKSSAWKAENPSSNLAKFYIHQTKTYLI